jgi:hypothetical protein
MSGETLTFELKYLGRKHYKPIDVLDKSELKILGSNANKEEASAIIAGCITLADELIITQIGDLKFEAGIIKIDLKKLKWRAYTKRNLWERKLDEILGRETKDINKDTIGFVIFEAFNNMISQVKSKNKWRRRQSLTAAT